MKINVLFSKLPFVLGTCFVLLTTACQSSTVNNKEKGNNDSAIENSTTEKTNVTVVDTFPYNKKITDAALFIAGMAVDEKSELFQLTQTQVWKNYAKKCDTSWNKFNQKVSNSVAKWIEKEIPNVSDTFKTLFYPFSGPDFVNANIYFPNATKYILFGLEPAGSIPNPANVKSANMAGYLDLHARSINSVISQSFFHTNDMKVKLDNQEIDGTTPIILLFMARANKKIIEVKPFEHGKNGELVYKTEFKRYKGDGNYGKGVEIKFRDAGDPTIKTLIYFSANIADGGLGINKPTREFLKTVDSNCIAYVKSATYLMHKSYFSIIRNTVLDKASIILQDDSGVGFKFFEKKKWSIQLYGTYDKPIALFENHFEEDLFQAYKTSKVKELPFRTGYDAKSNLLLARKIK